MKVKVSNSAIIHDALLDLREALAGYIGKELNSRYGSSWWSEAVLKNISSTARINLPTYGPYGKLVDSLDVAACLSLLTGRLWNEVFKQKLPYNARNWANELHTDRIECAHAGAEDFSESDTLRALDTMARLAHEIDAETEDSLRERMRELQYGSKEDSRSAEAIPVPAAPAGSSKTPLNSIALQDKPSGLKSWREIMQPHRDVAEGRYRTAEFAADLAQVARGEADNEYQDVVEFFSRTYLTEGLRGLLTEALKRISGLGGEPVIQLKTAFGGGKTHSLLAIYHLFRKSSRKDSLPAVRSIAEAAGIDKVPHANVVTVVGTRLDPAKAKRPPNLPGTTVNTVWGEIAYQLAVQTGNPDLYRIVKESDRKGVSPGADALQELFDQAGPTVVLLDELVAYAKKLYGAKDLPAGTHDNFITFIQEITEAAKSSKNGLVIASIPESELEIGGEAGEITLRQIEHTMGRTEAVWKPVAADEGFEVVRRRLFGECVNPEAREAVCSAYARMYADSPDEFPVYAHMPDYKERLLSSYPIHPEMFDRLYEDWSTLDSFQRTRGVLRLMAATIHELWMDNDQGLLIMPGSLPLGRPAVREELSRYIPPEWNSVLDSEVDGKRSTPYKLEREKPYLAANMAARRVARTMMLGSAPSERGRRRRGISRRQIRLGTAQPGESLATFNDALETLKQNLSYLYIEPSTDTYWYDTRPTLRKTAADKVQALSLEEAESEIVRRLSKEKAPRGLLGGVHPAPESSGDVSDENAARLVILPPSMQYDTSVSDESNNALLYAKDILGMRGNNQRTNKNMLIFAAPDSGSMPAAVSAAKWFLAWSSILADRERLNLDAAQIRETKEQVTDAERRLIERVRDAYSWLLVPEMDLGDSKNEIRWTMLRMHGSDEGIAEKAAASAVEAYKLMNTYGANTLNQKLNRILWNGRNHLSIRELWDYYSQYLYLERLASQSVLQEAVRKGLSDNLFAWADGFDGERYTGLRMSVPGGFTLATDGLIVRPEAAEVQFAAEAGNTLRDDTDSIEPPVSSPTPPTEASAKHFTLSAPIQTAVFREKAEYIAEYILDILSQQPDSRISIKLDIEAANPNGFSKGTQRIIDENLTGLDGYDYADFSN